MHLVPKINTPNNKSIKILEECLEKARSGELQEIYLLGVLDNKNMLVSLSPTESIALVLGYFEVIKRDFLNKVGV